MGEYLTASDGRQIAKIGTMGHMMYFRRSELELWKHRDAGLNTNVPALLADPHTLYRFPWPWEDDQSIEIIGQRKPFVTVTFTYADADVAHKEMLCQITPKECSGYLVNLLFPCPMDSSMPFPVKVGYGDFYPLINIYGVRVDANGRERTIFRCSWCEAPFSVTDHEAEDIGHALCAYNKDYQDIADRIRGTKNGGAG